MAELDPVTERHMVSAELILLGRIEAWFRLETSAQQLARWKQCRHDLSSEDMGGGWAKYDHLLPLIVEMLWQADRQTEEAAS